MKYCPFCHHELSPTDRVCPGCGADPDATLAAPANEDPRATVATPASRPQSTAAKTEARFIPGTMIKDRYRIVGLLGRGGMGEVYRADDLKLGQAVALKFLPPGLDANPDRLSRLLAEVRTARQVTHQNVCRVYDIDDVEGQHFLTMEYVDGEDLSSLLLRIGRLPEERAVAVARQICAGLAAAHDQGILHRDLKPANVMVDGRGQVRLTDFGLAGLADQIKENEIGFGTPAYMAPEQIAGREVSTRSDIYALGLVLYELFTGQAAFKANSVAELKHLHTSVQPSHLTQHVTALDPAVERAVMHCLEKDPGDRPASALAVSAALPGGDPLAAALAAGETPAPELVAQMGERSGMAPTRVLGLTALALLTLLGASLWAGSLTITRYLPLDKRPEVLADKARDVLAELGYDEDVYTQPVDQAWGYFVWDSVIKEVAAADTTGQPWAALQQRPDAYSFWYRQSPHVMRPTPYGGPIFVRGSVAMTNPPQINPADVTVLLDGRGRLRRLEIMPTRYSLADSVTEPDWGQLFQLAGLDPTRFRPDRSRYQRFLAPDRRRAWTGTLAEQPDVPLRVEAGSYEGRPVLFNLASAASLISLGKAPQPQQPSTSWYMGTVLQPLLILLIVVVAARAMRQNVQQNRFDHRGARRFGLLCGGLFLVSNGLMSHALFTRFWVDEIWPLIAGGTFLGFAAWTLYAAAEPLGRRIWPTMFVSSSRLLSRPRVQWRDPLVGYSVLIAVIGGSLLALLNGPFRNALTPLWTGEPSQPLSALTYQMLGWRAALGSALNLGLFLPFMFVFVMALVVIRKFIRRLPLALALALVLWTLLQGAASIPSLVFGALSAAIMLVMLLRWGVVAMIVGRMVQVLLWQARISDWSAWYDQGAVLVLTLLIGLTVYGAWAAIGVRQESST